MARDPVKVSRNLDDNAIGNGIFTHISDGTDQLAVNADGSINAVISATDLDIRDLDAAQDNVAISDGTDTLAVNADGSINAVVTATNLDIRDLTHVSDSVKVGDGTDLLAVNADGSINAVVTATNLDIRDLTHASDSVKVGDGTDFLAVNADGSINVVVSGSSGTPVAVHNENASLASGASSNHDYTASGDDFKPTRVIVSGESIATFEILTGPTGTLVSRGKVRTSVENPNAEFVFPEGFTIADTEVVRVIRTNDSNKTHAVNSTIEGFQL